MKVIFKRLVEYSEEGVFSSCLVPENNYPGAEFSFFQALAERKINLIEICEHFPVDTEEMTYISLSNFIYNSILKGLFLSTGGILVGLKAFYILSRSTESDIFLKVKMANLGILGITGIIILISTLLISYITAYKTDYSNLTGL